jgi:apolipoprotein D and lipocalin family protein
MYSTFKLLTLSSLLFIQTSWAMGSNPTPPPTVGEVRLESYTGLWYEIQRISNRFQDNTPGGATVCFNTTAEYEQTPDGKISVKNTCTRKSTSGETISEVATAVAFAVEGSNNAKLKVNFTGIALLRWLGIGNGDYWILGLGPVVNGQYSWVLVGAPTYKYGWILSRTPRLDPNTTDEILSLARSLGYNTEAFQSHVQ